MMYDVLIVGAGPVGLTAALLFQRLGIRVLLVDRRGMMNTHPKARSLNLRSAEIYRVLGIEPTLRQWDFPKEARRILWLDSFCGEEIAQIDLNHEFAYRYSPCEPISLSQATLEEVLRKSLDQTLIEMKYQTTFLNATEEPDCLIATLQNPSGETFQVRAKYLLGADGAKSSVRKWLQIPSIGKEDLGKFVSIYFKANPYPIAPYRPSAAYFMLGDAVFARFIQSVNCRDEWLMGIKLGPELETDESNFHREYCLQFIRETFEIPKMEIDILDIEFWHMRVQMAENFRKGRAFLAGDAAHLLSPAGGYGMQTGIQDVHNLCWKLAAVIQEKMPEDILATYHQERFPTVQSNIDWSRHNQQGYTDIIRAAKSTDRKTLQQLISQKQPILNSLIQDIGFCYKENQLVFPDDISPAQPLPREFLPSARPGSRAPHLWLQGPQGVISTIDLFHDSFILLTDAQGHLWAQALKDHFPYTYRCIIIGENGDYIDINHDFHELYGLKSGEAVLIRPDGHICKRFHPNNRLLSKFALVEKIDDF